MTTKELDAYINEAKECNVDYFVDGNNNTVKLQASSNGAGPFVIRGDLYGQKILKDIVEGENNSVTFYYETNGHQFPLVIKHAVVLVKLPPIAFLDKPNWK